MSAASCGGSKGGQSDSDIKLFYMILTVLSIYLCIIAVVACNPKFQAWFFRVVEGIALNWRNPFRNFYYRA